MHTLLDFNFLAILNLFVILLWPANTYASTREYAGKGVVGIIMIILTIIAVVLDIFFLVLKLVH